VNKQLFCLVMLVAFALTAAPQAVSAGESRSVELRVSKHDTLKELCRKYLQQPERWPAIAQLNRLAKPDLLTPGQRLVIPVDMLKGVPLEARVTFLKGAGFQKLPGAAQWQPLHLGDVVRVGSALKSGPGSSVEVAFADGSLFLLRENTVITVKTAQSGLLHLLRVLYLEAGKVITRVKAATGRDSRFEIETPSALAAARGTEYRVGVDAQSTTRAEMLERSIAFSSMGSTVALNEDEGSLAKFQEPPAPPRKLLPPPEPVDLKPSYGAAPLALRFSPVAGASWYRAVLARDRQGRDTVREALIRPGESLEATPEADGVYYVIASSLDADGLEGRLSQPREVILRQEAPRQEPRKPAVPAIRLPDDAARLRSTRTEIAWLPIAGAAHYQLQLASDPEFRQLVTDAKGLDGTAYSTRALTTGSYYLRLRVQEGDAGAGEWSAVSSFTVLQLPPPALRRTASAGKGKGWDFAWDQPEAGIASQIQLSGDPEFGTVLLDQTLARPELHLDKPLAPGTYYVRVRGIDAEHHAGSFSEVAQFVVEKPARFPYEFLGVGAVLLMFLL